MCSTLGGGKLIFWSPFFSLAKENRVNQHFTYNTEYKMHNKEIYVYIISLFPFIIGK